MNFAVAIVLVFLLGVLTVVSYVDRVYAEIGKFLSREFQNNIESFEQKVEPKLRMGRSRVSLAMTTLVPLTMAAIAMVVGFAVFRSDKWSGYEVLQASLSLILIVIVFNRFLPFVFLHVQRVNGWCG